MRNIQRIIDAILKERQFQDAKYGPVLDPHPLSTPGAQGPGGHELGTWSVILESEVAEFKKALVHGGSKAAKGRDSARAELVQIAAVAIAALEQHGLEEL